MRINYIFSLSIVALITSGCASWNSTNENKPAVLPAITQQSKNLSIVWQQDVGKPINEEIGQTTLSTIGLDIIAASKSGEISRINSQTGNKVWNVKVGKIQAGVASNDKYIVFVNTKNQLIVLDANGKHVWSSKLEWNVQTSPYINDNVVVLRTTGNKLIAFNLESQKLIWQHERIVQGLLLHSKRNALLAPKKDFILAGFHNAKIVLLEAQTGLQKWEQTLSYTKGFTEPERINDIVSTPIVYAESACAVSYQGKIGCFDLSNGELSWESAFSGINNLINDNEAIYATDIKGNISAFDYSGKLKWQQNTLYNRSLSDGVLIDNFLVYNDYKGFLHIIDKNTGSFVGRAQIADNSVPMIKVGNTIIMQSNSGKLYGISLNK